MLFVGARDAADGRDHPPEPMLLRRGWGGEGRLPSQESCQRPRCQVRRLGVIGIFVDVGMVVEVPRSAIDAVEGAADCPIFPIVAIKAADEEVVNDPREIGALAEGAVEAEPTWTVSAGRVVEGDRLSIAEPHQEVGDCRVLLLQLRCKIAASRDEQVSFIGQVARGGFGEVPLLWRFPSGLLHRRRQ